MPSGQGVSFALDGAESAFFSGVFFFQLGQLGFQSLQFLLLLTNGFLLSIEIAIDDPDEVALLDRYKATVAGQKEAKDSATKLLRAAADRARKRLQNEPDHEDLRDLRALSSYIELTEQISLKKRQLEDAEARLDAKTYSHYSKLTEVEIQTLVVDDKWLASLDAAIHGEMDRISETLAQRVKELAERYERPMPQMISRVVDFETKVSCHLEKMGFSWK